MASCFDKSEKTNAEVQECARRCAASFEQTQHVLRSQLENFQGRIERSMQQCQDEARDVIKPGEEQSASSTTKAQIVFENCACTKLRGFSKMVPDLRARLESHLSSMGSQ